MDPAARLKALEQSHDELRALLRLALAALSDEKDFLLKEKIPPRAV